MKKHMKHEFGNTPPSLFDKGVMGKNTKSVLADALKSNVTPLDGGQLLIVVVPYQVVLHVINMIKYVLDMYVLDNFGNEVTVIFNGYWEAMSTNVAEQQRTATWNTSPDIFFELYISTAQNCFLANRRNTARFIGYVMAKLENVGAVCSPQMPTII